MTCPDVMDLERFVLRDLDDDSYSSIASHVSSCAQCAGEIEQLGENLRLAPALRRDQEPTGAPAEEFNWVPAASIESNAAIGPYRILRKIGQGGMGAVFEAQQENPRRTVALKVIRPGLVTPSLLARFRHEAQTLARLHHPGIAQVFEAGQHPTADGPQPYFAMELVHGEPLLKYAQSRRLTANQRLELIARICDAVRHAHQRGVIHRDLKPDNILVEDAGAGEPQPKILDFGVARVIDPSGQTTTLHTSAGQIVGTVAYMSPEQASADPAQTDTRADVYALGVICFQLLADRLPYKLNNASVAESVRVIVQDEPTQLASIDRKLKGDVTTIVGKALEKEKNRRYQSAAEMAADIRRYLRDEPIAAHPPSTIYQVRKFARRHKGLVGGIAAAFVLLVAGVIGTTLQMFRAERARATADTMRVAADKSAAEARSEAAKQAAVNNFLQEMLGAANPRNLTAADRAKGANISVLDALKQASRRVDDGALKDQPEIELAVRSTVATAFESLGDYDTADHHFQAALELSKRLRGPESPQAAEILVSLVNLRSLQGRLPEADALARQALEMSRKVFDDADPGVAVAVESLGELLVREGKPAEAEPLLRDAVARYRRAFGDGNKETASALNNLAFVLTDQDKLPEAESLYREALAVRRKVLGDHPDTATTINNLAMVLRDQRRFDESDPLFRESLAMRRKTLGDEHPDVATAMSNLALELHAQAKYAEAEPLFRQALEIERKFDGPEHPKIAILLNNIGGLFLEQRKFAEAEPCFRESLAMRRKLLGDEHPAVAQALANLGDVLRQSGKPADAEPLYRQAVAISVKRLGEDHLDTAARRALLGGCLTMLARYDEAERELLAAARVVEAKAPRGSRYITVCFGNLVKLYQAWQKPEQATAWRAKLPTTRPSSRTSVAAVTTAPS